MPQFLYPFLLRGIFHIFNIADFVAVNIDIIISCSDFTSFVYIPSSGIDWSHKSIFSFLKILHTDFLCFYTKLHSYQQFSMIPFSNIPASNWCWLISPCRPISLESVGNSMIFSFICFSLINSHSYSIWFSSSEKCLTSYLPISFCFSSLEKKMNCCFIVNHFELFRNAGYWSFKLFANIFIHFVDCFFTSLNIFFAD